MNRQPSLQHTIARPVRVAGRGYWSGAEVTVEFRPAEAGSGLRFVRRDLPARPGVDALVHCRREIPRRTVLVDGAARVDMVEHILAALSGMGIDNCEIWVDAEEMPASDGSSREFVEALRRAGSTPLNVPRRVLSVIRPLRVGDRDCWVEALPSPEGRFELQYDLDYGASSPIGRQSYRLQVTPESFGDQLAAARTFLLEEEAAALRARNIGLHTGYQDLLVFGPDGPIENSLRFADECVRHKLLDMVGDLALAGASLIGRFHASRSGHRLNAELVRALLADTNSLRATA